MTSDAWHATLAIRRSIRLVAALLAVALAATACTPHSRKGTGYPAAGRATTGTGNATAPAPPLDTSRAAAISSELAAGTDQGLRAALAVPAGQSVDPRAAGELAAVAPIRLDVSTFQRVDATHATVIGTVAHPPAGQPSHWRFTLIYLAGHWKIADAEPSR